MGSKTESRLWQLIRPHLPGRAMRIESWVSSGVPDVYGCCLTDKGLLHYWLELKVVVSGYVVGIRPAQIAWHTYHHEDGGNSKFLIRKEDILYLYPGRLAKRLAEQGLRLPSPIGGFNKPWQWATIAKLILNPE